MPTPKRTVRLKRQPRVELSGLCALMANDLRRAVIVRLAAGPRDVSTLAAELGTTMPWLSHNLKRLLDQGIIAVRKTSNRRVYSLSAQVRATKRGGRTTLEFETRHGAGLRMTLPRR